MIGYGVGAPQAGITLIATCTPFDVIPPALWEGLKKAIMQSAADWGLTVRISEHPSLQDGKQHFWKLERMATDARIEAERKLAGG